MTMSLQISGLNNRILTLQVLDGLDALVILAGDPDLVGHAIDAAMYNSDIESLRIAAIAAGSATSP